MSDRWKRIAGVVFYIGGLIVIAVVYFNIVQAWNDAKPCVDHGGRYDCTEDRIPPERGR